MNTKPAGTITFLFTDIEGSTRLLQAHPDGYESMLVRQREIIGSSAAARNGVIVDTAGDSCFAAFSRAVDAVLAAVEAQRSLCSEAWPAGEQLRVRIGLHTGAPSVSAEGYVGIDVHKAARIAAAARGGQILASRATAGLVESELPAGINLRDLGLQRLKDLTLPDNLFQIGADGLQTEFPALRTLDSRNNNLPLQPTSFIGREEEFKKAKRLLAGNRLLTLTGPGGAGKTRLALQLAADALEEFADGVYFVSLAPITDPANLSGAIAEALPFTPGPREETLTALARYLEGLELLLVIDNFEHMVSAATVVSRLLENASGLKVLTTSREPLGLAGEQEFPVPPLLLPSDVSDQSPDILSKYASVQLFIQRTQAINPAFQLTAMNAQAVCGICIRLDGLPLSLELAAARMKLFTPQKLLDRLDNRFSLLRAIRKNTPVRQQTLRNTIDWSYNLLDEGERTLFARFAVFAGGCTLEAAEQICGSDSLFPPSIDVVNGIDSLLNKSLLRQSIGSEGEPRFYMLETIREYAAEHLASSSESKSLEREHVTFFADMAERFRAAQIAQGVTREEDVAWIRRFAADHDNFRAALARSYESGNLVAAYRIVGGLGVYYLDQGSVSEALQWAGRLLQSGADVDPNLEYFVTRIAGQSAHAAGDTAGAKRYFTRAEQLAELTGNRVDLGYAIMMGVWGHIGDPVRHEELERKTRRAMALFEEARNLSGYASAHVSLGELYRAQGRYEEARVEYEASIEARPGGSLHGAFNNLGFVHYRLGNREIATGFFGRILTEERNGTLSPLSVGYALVGMAAVSSDPERAARLLASSNRLFTSSGAVLDHADQLEYEAVLARVTEALDSASLEKVRTDSRTMSIRDMIAYALEEAGVPAGESGPAESEGPSPERKNSSASR